MILKGVIGGTGSSRSGVKPLSMSSLPKMQTNTVTPDTNQPYTILRIKRKRNEEPLDALGRDAAIVLC